MTVIMDRERPALLIGLIAEAYRNSQDVEKVIADQRSVLTGWLNTALVDFERLDAHIAQLQIIFKSSFRYESARRDGIAETSPAPSVTMAFPLHEKLSDSDISGILDQGLDVLSHRELGLLAINPFALYDLYDAIDEISPEYWLDQLHQLTKSGNAYLPTQRSADSESSIPKDYVVKIGELVDRAIRSRGVSSLEPHAKRRHSRSFDYRTIISTAALAACFLIGWQVLRLNQSQNTLNDHLATLIDKQSDITGALAQLTKTNANLLAQTNPGNPLVPTSATGTGNGSLSGLFRKGYFNLNLEPVQALRDIEKEAIPEVRELIKLKQNERELNAEVAREIIRSLRELAESQQN